MNTTDFAAFAYQKLRDMEPRIWDTDAHDAYVALIKRSQPDATGQDIENGWRDGLAQVKNTLPKQWKQYEQAQGFIPVSDAIQWENVTFVEGRTDGDRYEITLNVGEKPCVIECTDVQLDDPDYIVRKLRFYSCEEIACPYLSKSKRQNWFPAVVRPWLKHERMKHAKRHMISDGIMDAIVDFCMSPITAESATAVWSQSRDAVREGEYIYIPYNGVTEYIRRAVGKDSTSRSITTILAALGGEPIRKTREKHTFWKIPYVNLYDANSEAGSGQNDGDSPRSPRNPESGWDGFTRDLCQEEPGGHAAEAGLDDGREKETLHRDDASCSGVPAREGGQDPELDAIPF